MIRICFPAMLPPVLMAAMNALALPLLIEIIVQLKSSVGRISRWITRIAYLNYSIAHIQSAESKLNQAALRLSSYHPVLRFCSALSDRP